jgi:HEAT repeat protein/protein-S-isoprenylcysteine O-methyltransferase Ste14
MKTRFKHLSFLALLAVIFTIGLTFASIELPRLLDTVLVKNIDTPDVATGLNEASDLKTELYLRHFHLRLIGFGCLALIVILIVVGFVTERTGWTSAGALVLFLPVFGHFAATMFFLGGLGFLRLPWLPVLDVSFRLFRLGEVVKLPYDILLDLYSLTGLGRWIHFSPIVTGLGLLIFFIGTWTWFYARAQKIAVVDLWIYRFSRHPQYLGWIIWSYGVMFLPGSNIKLCYELSNSLPWLLSTMIIIGVAMLEEVKMKRVYGGAYESYRVRAPFLIPFPRFMAKASSLPIRLLFKKPYPERKREIFAVLAFYTVLCLGGSVFYGRLVPLPAKKPDASEQRIQEFARILKDAGNRAEKRRAADVLAGMGEPALKSLVALLGDKDAIVRAYSAAALGGIKSDGVIGPLTALLDDSDRYVRRTAAESLGRTGSANAIQPLVVALEDQARDVAPAAALALGRIRHPDVIPPLIRAVRDTSLNATGAAAQALGELGAREAIGPLIQCFEETPNCPYDLVGGALWKLNSERAVDAWIAGLKKGSSWYPRASCATELGKIKLEKGIPALQEALKDERPEVRRAAVLALMKFRSDKTIEALRGALMDKDFEVRMYAEEALKRIGSPEK